MSCATLLIILAKTKPASAESGLSAALNRIADELRVVRDVLDEMRADMQWAVQNGRVVVQVEPPQSESAPSPLTLFEEGDAVEFEHGSEVAFGEVVETNDGLNEAVVLLIPSNERVTVRQDDLQRVEPDPLSRRDTSSSATAPEPVRELPKPGQLF